MITRETITKCCRHVGFYIDDANENHANMVCDDKNVISLQEIIDNLDIKAKLTAHDYIQTEDNYQPVNVLEMTKEDIINLIKETGKVENNDNTLEDSICDNLTITETVKEEVPNFEHCKSLL